MIVNQKYQIKWIIILNLKYCGYINDIEWILIPLGACLASWSLRNIRSKYVNSRRFMPGWTQGNNLLNIHGGCLNVKERRASNSYTRGIRLDLSLWSKSQRDSRLQNLLTITDWICNIRTLSRRQSTEPRHPLPSLFYILILYSLWTTRYGRNSQLVASTICFVFSVIIDKSYIYLLSYPRNKIILLTIPTAVIESNRFLIGCVNKIKVYCHWAHSNGQSQDSKTRFYNNLNIAFNKVKMKYI